MRRFLLLLPLAAACSAQASSTEGPPPGPPPILDAGHSEDQVAPISPPDECLDALVKPSGALESLNSIALSFANELATNPGSDPLVEMAGYPSLCSGVGGNADYGVNADVFFTGP